MIYSWVPTSVNGNSCVESQRGHVCGKVHNWTNNKCSHNTQSTRSATRLKRGKDNPDTQHKSNVDKKQIRSRQAISQHEPQENHSNIPYGIRPSLIVARHILLVACLTILSVLVGCGGGGTVISPPYDESVFSITSAGGDFQMQKFSVVLPVRTDRPASTITLRQYSTQLDRAAEHYNTGTSYEFGVDRSILESESEIVLRIPVDSRSTGDFLIAQRGRDGELVFQNLAQEVRTNEVRFTLSHDNLVRALSAANISNNVAVLTFSVAERKPLIESSRGFGSSKLLQLKNGTLQEFSVANGLNNKRVAVISHGLNNKASSMLDTHDDVVLQMYPLLDARNYDLILFYEYWDTSEGVAENGRRLSQKLIEVGASNSKQIDMHGHSMGGLVSRWAIEKEPIGSYVTRLFCYGTPHLGVPADILLAAAWGYTVVEGYRDLYDNSLFLQALNRDDSPHKGRIPYYVLAGTSSDYKVFGVDVGRWTSLQYVWYGNLMGNPDYYLPHDGIVSRRSAIPANLSRFGLVSGSSSTSLNRNHSDIANGSDVRSAVQVMLKASGSGVIR